MLCLEEQKKVLGLGSLLIYHVTQGLPTLGVSKNKFLGFKLQGSVLCSWQLSAFPV